jgi:hypothetical protein
VSARQAGSTPDVLVMQNSNLAKLDSGLSCFILSDNTVCKKWIRRIITRDNLLDAIKGRRAWHWNPTDRVAADEAGDGIQNCKSV